jgi:ribosomal protein L11 methyltransferase
MPYVVRSWSLPAELEEVVTAELWSQGIEGCQTVDGGEGVLAAPGIEAPPAGRVRVVAWFPAGTAGDPDPLSGWFAEGVEPLGVEEAPDEDWLAAWRERAQPFPLGRGFWVDPREPEDDPKLAPLVPPDGRRLLLLPARSAFGVGSHESTRLAVELLEEAALPGRDVLDVGTGTGILAFAALYLGAREALGLDLDPAAAVAARENAGRNGFDLLVYAGDARALAAGVRFDWALINIVPELILPSLPAIAARVDGMVLSGILAEKGPAVLGTVEDLGFVERARAEAGEWIAFRVERPEADHLAIPPIPAALDLPGARGAFGAAGRPATATAPSPGAGRSFHRPALSLSKGGVRS